MKKKMKRMKFNLFRKNQKKQIEQEFQLKFMDNLIKKRILNQGLLKKIKIKLIE